MAVRSNVMGLAGTCGGGGGEGVVIVWAVAVAPVVLVLRPLVLVLVLLPVVGALRLRPAIRSPISIELGL